MLSACTSLKSECLENMVKMWALEQRSSKYLKLAWRIFETYNHFSFLIFQSKPFTTIPACRATSTPSTLQEGRLGLIHKKPSCRPTGKLPFPRSVSVWRSASRSSLSSSPSKPTPCTHWSLTGNSEPPHWVATRGSLWVKPKRPYSVTVARKGLMSNAAARLIPKRGWVS